MLPIYKRLREKEEAPQSGLIVETRQSDYNQEGSAVECIEPFAVAILMAIAAKDPAALAQALVDAHDEMHASMDKTLAEPHSYASQNMKAAE